MVGGTTFELLTPRGHGGVAVIAVHGEQRWQRVAELFQTAEGRPVRPTAGPQLVTMYLDGQATDQVLLVDRTARACLEVHMHGSPAVVAGLEEAVGGWVESLPIDSRQRILETARSRAQLGLCLEQAELDFEAQLQDAAGDAEALRAIDRRSEVARAQLLPCRLVICGSQNAGKSTLMNRLLFQERVLTGDLPGLTRDPVREIAVLGGYPYELIDTAGEGDPDSNIDWHALERARRERTGALRLLVVDGTSGPSDVDRGIRDELSLVVRSKDDLVSADWPVDFPADLRVSCLDPMTATAVRTAIGERLRRFRRLPMAGPVGGGAALTDREIALLRTALARHEPPAV